jgi:hypothetical protein
MEIMNCITKDLSEIMYLYEAARELQRARKMVIWSSFEQSFILREIEEKRQWKIVDNSEIFCNWAITFSDKEIWTVQDKNDSIYIHRICNNPNFRGNRCIDQIVAWAKVYAPSIGKRFIRLDTLGNNLKLIKHYTSAGFEYLGIHHLTNTSTLPTHYQDEPNCCLFEIDLKKGEGEV